MESLQAPKSHAWLALPALALATAAFGFDLVGRFCLFAGPSLVAVQALRTGTFPFLFGRHQLIRRQKPRLFWAAIIIDLLIAGGCLYLFAKTALQAAAG